VTLRYCIVALCLFITSPAYSDSLEITIVSLKDESRLQEGISFAGITVETHRPVRRAVELAIYESKQLAGVSRSGMLILDLPLEVMIKVAKLSNDMKTVAFNVRHSDSSLRESLCLPYVFHTIPSDGMYFDALGQFLVYRGWRKVLLVKGPSKEDTQRARSLLRSLKKFGTTIVDERTFTLSHHPDDRDENKPEFLTGGISYDVVAVIDSKKDYGRYLQYSTRSARPVVGDVGLTPRSWHFALERYGAPQLNERYRQFKPSASTGPQAAMTDAEFAAWSAVKLITNSINSRPPTSDIDLHAVLSDPSSQVDLYKGTRGSVRLWNHQLRQPILLAAPQAVIAIAPMPKFLHPKHYVDTLGIDEPESVCQLN